MIKYKNNDRSMQARGARYWEYLTLRSLPFMNAKQARRFKLLEKLRRWDNRAAFQESLERQQQNAPEI